MILGEVTVALDEIIAEDTLPKPDKPDKDESNDDDKQEAQTL